MPRGTELVAMAVGASMGAPAPVEQSSVLDSIVCKELAIRDPKGLRPTWFRAPQDWVDAIFRLGLIYATFAAVMSMATYGGLSAPWFLTVSGVLNQLNTFTEMSTSILVNGPQFFRPSFVMFMVFQALLRQFKETFTRRSSWTLFIVEAFAVLLSIGFSLDANKAQAGQNDFSHWSFMRTDLASTLMQVAAFGMIFASFVVVLRRSINFMKDFLHPSLYFSGLQTRFKALLMDHLEAKAQHIYSEEEFLALRNAAAGAVADAHRLRLGETEEEGLMAGGDVESQQSLTKAFFSTPAPHGNTHARLNTIRYSSVLFGLLSTLCNWAGDVAIVYQSKKAFPAEAFLFGFIPLKVSVGFLSGISLMLFTGVFTTEEIITAFLNFLPYIASYAKENTKRIALLCVAFPFIAWFSAGPTLTTNKDVFPLLYHITLYFLAMIFGVGTTNTIFAATQERDREVRSIANTAVYRSKLKDLTPADQRSVTMRCKDLLVRGIDEQSLPVVVSDLKAMGVFRSGALNTRFAAAFGATSLGQVRDLVDLLSGQYTPENMNAIYRASRVRTFGQRWGDLAYSLLLGALSSLFLTFMMPKNMYSNFLFVLPVVRLLFNVFHNLCISKNKVVSGAMPKDANWADVIAFYLAKLISTCLEVLAYPAVFFGMNFVLSIFSDPGSLAFTHADSARMIATGLTGVTSAVAMWQAASAKEDAERPLPLWQRTRLMN